MNNFLEGLKRKSGPRSVASHAICSQAAFNFLIHRERSRADRGHGVFSLVVFNWEPDRKPAMDRQLINVLKNRIRITDSIGWLTTTSMGVLLADTPLEGGTAFLEDILRETKDMHPAPECHIYTYPESCDSPVFATHPVETDVTSTEKVFNELLARSPSIGRQALERVAAGFAVIFLSPLFLLIALAIKRHSPGPTFFSQLRIGHKGELFRCYKFRTMHVDADTNVHATHFKTLIGNAQPMRKLDTEDPRIFRIGRLLRSSSLDELPQLFNIAKGEMSFIGPRPAIPGEYRAYLPWHRHRIDVLPGLTGLWQVNGKNKTTFDEMVRFDTFYSRHNSLRMDIQIIFKTPAVVINQFWEDHHLRVQLLSRMNQEHKKERISNNLIASKHITS